MNDLAAKAPRWLAPLVISVVLAGVLAVLLSSVALDHNPQGDYCRAAVAGEPCSIRWANLLKVGGAWFVLGMAVFSALSFGLAHLIRTLRAP